MNDQQRRLKKRQKREKIRKQHLQQTRIDHEQEAVDFFTRSLDKQICPPMFIPDRNDRDGWQKLGLFRCMKKTWDRAIEIFENQDR
jgi:hypothetical protein